MKRIGALIIGLMVLASCASAGNSEPRETTQAKQEVNRDPAKDAGQDFSNSDFLNERRRQAERRGYI